MPIWDVHLHISGAQSAAVLQRVADVYGIKRLFSMTPLEEVESVRAVFADRIEFIATIDFRAADRQRALSTGYAERLRRYADAGARVAKFWSAPRGVDFAEQTGAAADAFRLDCPHVLDNMALAVDLGMSIMVHVGDPDTWFATHYTDASRYGSKEQQYAPLEKCLRQFNVPFIAAHLGGWPENLAFLSELLSRHDQLYLDTSATKWMVRELSRHAPSERQAFFGRWRHRLLFGSDIVTRDNHLRPGGQDEEDLKSNSVAEAFDLYASRYHALRLLLETNYEGESPIADPDLHLVDPEHFQATDAPIMIGSLLPRDVLQCIYYETPQRLFYATHR